MRQDKFNDSKKAQSRNTEVSIQCFDIFKQWRAPAGLPDYSGTGLPAGEAGSIQCAQETSQFFLCRAPTMSEPNELKEELYC